MATHVHGGEGFVESSERWKPHPLFSGPTPAIDGVMKVHVSVLSPGHCPHPPHCHVEEELLVVLRGEAEILIANSPGPACAEVKRFEHGSFIYYPAYQYHTLRNASAAPVTYLMLKWQAAPLETEAPLATTVSDMGGTGAAPNSAPMTTRVLFEGPTAYLSKLHAHVTDSNRAAATQLTPIHMTSRSSCFPEPSKLLEKPWGPVPRSIMRPASSMACETWATSLPNTWSSSFTARGVRAPLPKRLQPSGIQRKLLC